MDIWSDDDEPEAFVRECLEQRKAHNHSNKDNKDAHADISGRGVLVHDIFDDQDEVVSLMPGQMSCPVCSESVSASYLQHHLVSCNITYMLCPSDECGQLIRRTDQKRHIKFGHKKVKYEARAILCLSVSFSPIKLRECDDCQLSRIYVALQAWT